MITVRAASPKQKTAWLGKIDGWRWRQGTPLRFGNPIPGEKIVKRGWHKGKSVRAELPRYLSSLDALRPLILELKVEQMRIFARYLKIVCSDEPDFEGFWPETLTRAYLNIENVANAVLVAHGKYKP